MLTIQEIATYVGAVQTDGVTPDITDEFLVSCSREALGLVNKHVKHALVPLDETEHFEQMCDRAVKELTATLYQRKSNQNGIAAINGDGSAIFVAKDPMHSIYPLLRKWVLPF